MEKFVEVTQCIKVKIDESKFDSEFLKEFSETIHPFTSIDGHIKYLAELYARGFIDTPNDFIEGYGEMKDMGIEFSNEWSETEIIKE